MGAFFAATSMTDFIVGTGIVVGNPIIGVGFVALGHFVHPYENLFIAFMGLNLSQSASTN